MIERSERKGLLKQGYKSERENYIENIQICGIIKIY